MKNFGKIIRLLVLALAVAVLGFILQKENKSRSFLTGDPFTCVFPDAHADIPSPGGPEGGGECSGGSCESGGC